MKYRKKPVIIEAIQFKGGAENCREVMEFLNPGLDFNAYTERIADLEKYGFHIHTLEGDMLCSLGDYVIKGVKGEFYPCKPDIFESTYEEVK